VDPAELTMEALARYDAAVPRYTSYPTAPEWRDVLTEIEIEEALAGVRSPASLYVHVPFCREQCWFCGCNMVVSGNTRAADRYLDALERQIERLPHRPSLLRQHLGGGTPTWLTQPQLVRLYDLLNAAFPRQPGMESSIEIDPDVTSDEVLDQLVAMGVTRISLGVQSFDPKVLHAIGRPQDPDRIGALVERARGHGLRGLNFDLIYGLPHQDDRSMARTLQEVVALRPDRIALYGYAHLPRAKPHQRRIDPAALPSSIERLRQFLSARDQLVRAGYRWIGLDHFALPDDELAQADASGRLHRNFMGYTTRAELEVLGLGVSGISELSGTYLQQHPHLGQWYRAVAAGERGVERACRLGAEDVLRRDVIARWMCRQVLIPSELEAQHGIDFERHFAPELQRLVPLQQAGLVERGTDRIELSAQGRLLVRTVAAVFDHRLGEHERFSAGI
jgi:oxygen-independent coproporphyrinogen-3 oxidase